MATITAKIRPDDVCPVCRISRSSTTIQDYESSYTELEAAAGDHCPRCLFVFKCIQWAIPVHFNVEDVENIHVSENAPIIVKLPAHQRRDFMYLDLYSLAGTPPVDPGPLKIQRTRFPLPQIPLDEVAFQRIGEWTEECLSNHRTCCPGVRSLETDFTMPTRILDLTSGKVVLREDMTAQVYACLSHCWGNGAAIVKTTLATKVKFKQEVPWRSLPKSFQDAVDICRRLRIFYLWIDSLCIVQDSHDDWAREASRMADIYENAYVTIAATKAKDSTYGCYAETSAPTSASLVPGFVDLYIRKAPKRFPEAYYERNFNPDIPLLHRGWIYQEMRLSARVLHFCSDEVVFECLGMRRSQSGCNDKSFLYFKRDTSTVDSGSIPYQDLLEDPRRLWYRTIQEYTRLALTFESDLMPALAALIKRMEPLRGDDRFLAGLWEKTLLSDLLWMARPFASAPKLANAPTWSWVNMPSYVSWDPNTIITISSAEVVNVEYRYEGPSHMANFSDARITVRAPLIPAELYFPEHYKRDLWSGFLLERHMRVRQQFYDHIQSLPGDMVISKYQRDELIDPMRPSDSTKPPEAYFMMLGSNPAQYRYDGICIQKVSGSTSYRRFGRVTLAHRYTLLKEMPEGGEGRMLEDTKKFLDGVPISDITLI